MHKTIGLIAAPPTAFHENGTIDLKAIPPLAAHLEAQGVRGVFVNGTTGEGFSLTLDEREQLAEAWRSALPASMRLFVHAGHNCLPDACRLAAHAQRIGADAMALIAPNFYKPAGIEPLVDWCATIAAAAPDLPFYYYHMPAMTGVTLSVSHFIRAAAPNIASLRGVKFTCEDMVDYQAALNLEAGRFDVLWGRDEMLLAALATGAQGAVGSNYNMAAPLFIKLIDAFQQGDLNAARRYQEQATNMITAMVATGHFIATIKAMLREQGVPISTRFRQPLENPSAVTLAVPAVPGT